MAGPSPAAGVSDTVDLDALVELAARRLVLAVDVAAAKFVSGQRVDDVAREREILDLAAARLGESGHDGRVAFFRDQIEASKIIQRGLLAHWGSHPKDFPERSRGLAEDIRPALDAINRQMLLLVPRLKGTTPERRVLAQATLDRKLAATPALRELGGVRREAADLALRSLPWP
jgi:chorismate mutase